ncbi:MAG: hypothetical protein E7425_12950 [Ruminococcaceae bacterium]|nr:hypothetical protein [Oscillospiraceae bacterium]
MLKFKQKIGVQTTGITAVSLVLTVAVVLTVTLILMRQYSNDVLKERARIGNNILIDTVEQKRLACEEAYWVEIQSDEFMEAIVNGDAATIEYIFDTDYVSSDEGLFVLVVDGSGNLIYHSSTYPFSSVDSSLSLNEINGIVKKDDQLAIFYSSPVEDDSGRVYGVTVGFNLATDAWMETVKNNVECDVTIFRDNIRLSSTIVDPSTNKSVVGTAMGESINKQVLQQQKEYVGKAKIVGLPYYVSYVPMYDHNGALCGAYFAGSEASEVSSYFVRVIMIAIAIGVVAAAITIVCIRVFVKKIVVDPISAVSDIAREMANGQLAHTEVDYGFKVNEIGLFADDLKKTRKQISDYITDITRILGAMGRGDFTNLPSMQYLGDFDEIHQSFYEIMQSLSSIVYNMDMSANGVSTGSNQIASGAQSLADGSTRQATAIEEINATVASISSQVSATAENANQANALAASSLDAVEKQNEQMTAMLAAMNDIKEQSSKISHIIQTIEDIAFQTNILALNASVEAARAGSAGKGFAVVADEVRNLAAKSAAAANDTNNLISTTIKAIDEGVSLAESTAESMKHVIERTKKTSSLISEIDRATVAQSEAVSQVSVGIQDISGVIAQNSATAEETAASCQDLATQSSTLKDQVSKFRVSGR